MESLAWCMTPKNTTKAGHDGGVKSLETAFRIVETVEALDGAGVTEVADETGLAKSTVHDHLATLRSNGFLVKDDGIYRVGLRFLDHGGRARNRLKIHQIAKPEIRKLADKTGELVNLAVEENELCVYIDYAKGEDAVNIDTYLGKREHLHNTALGKAILAYLPTWRVDEILEHHGLPAETNQTITSRRALEERLETVRDNGFAVDREERLEGLSCVAAPIKTGEGAVAGAISISGPTGRLENGRLTTELADEVRRTADVIRINITYS